MYSQSELKWTLESLLLLPIHLLMCAEIFTTPIYPILIFGWDHLWGPHLGNISLVSRTVQVVEGLPLLQRSVSVPNRLAYGGTGAR